MSAQPSFRIAIHQRGEKAHIYDVNKGALCGVNGPIDKKYHPVYANVENFELCGVCKRNNMWDCAAGKMVENRGGQGGHRSRTAGPSTTQLRDSSTTASDHTRGELPEAPDKFDQYVIEPSLRSGYRAAIRLQRFITP